MKVGFISLGCSKNLVDTEMTIGLFKEHQYKIVNDINEAEVIIINTCGFIESAKVYQPHARPPRLSRHLQGVYPCQEALLRQVAKG